MGMKVIPTPANVLAIGQRFTFRQVGVGAGTAAGGAPLGGTGLGGVPLGGTPLGGAIPAELVGVTPANSTRPRRPATAKPPRHAKPRR